MKFERWAPVGLVLLVLVIVNIFNNRLGPAVYVLTSWVGLAALLLIAHHEHESRNDIGLGRPSRAAWLAAGSLIAGVVLVYFVGSAIPATRDAFTNDKTSGLSTWSVFVHAFFLVPFGTVLFEEVAFRGVLLAMLKRRLGWTWAIVWSSVLFGIWHVLPSLSLSTSNAAVAEVAGDGWVSQVGGVLFAVIGTALAGAFFCLLRKRFDHIIVPAALHWATNGLGYLFAWALVTGRLF